MQRTKETIYPAYFHILLMHFTNVLFMTRKYENNKGFSDFTLTSIKI